MADTPLTSTAVVPDLDLEHALHQTFLGHAPLMHDRHRIALKVKDGHVTVTGHVKSSITRRYMAEHLSQVAGVQSLDLSGLYDDDTIRREAGHLVPPGVFVNVEYGAVILSGTLPPDMSIEALVGQIGALPGAHRVLTMFAPA
jgi:hypothetical protein